MTDEELEERVREAYADVRMSPEAEDRILANLLAAEADSVKGTGCLTGKSLFCQIPCPFDRMSRRRTEKRPSWLQQASRSRTPERLKWASAGPSG